MYRRNLCQEIVLSHLSRLNEAPQAQLQKATHCLILAPQSILLTMFNRFAQIPKPIVLLTTIKGFVLVHLSILPKMTKCFDQTLLAKALMAFLANSLRIQAMHLMMTKSFLLVLLAVHLRMTTLSDNLFFLAPFSF